MSILTLSFSLVFFGALYSVVMLAIVSIQRLADRRGACLQLLSAEIAAGMIREACLPQLLARWRCLLNSSFTFCGAPRGVPWAAVGALIASCRRGCHSSGHH